MRSKKTSCIFYADDDPEDQEMFRELLEQNDVTVQAFIFENGVSLVQHMEKLRPDQLPVCVFLDVNMPMWDGMETLEVIRKNTRYDEIPVIMFSTSSDTTEHKHCLELGATAFLTKPTDYKEFGMLAKQLAGYLENIVWRSK